MRTHPDTSFASLSVDIPWTAFAILVPCAVLSAVVAALLPSLRLGRLDVIGVMRGQSVSPQLNKVVPVVGLVLAVVGGAVVLSAARPQSGGELRVAFGAVGLVLGTLLLVPAILVAFGRLASRLPVAPRIATRDTEVGGTRIRKGMVVRPSPLAPNYDPDVFADPLRFDIHRKPKRILSFGAGPHHCVGNILGRTTITIAIRRLLARFPNARLADPDFVPVYGGAVGELRLQSLPMRIQ